MLAGSRLTWSWSSPGAIRTRGSQPEAEVLIAQDRLASDQHAILVTALEANASFPAAVIGRCAVLLQRRVRETESIEKLGYSFER